MITGQHFVPLELLPVNKGVEAKVILRIILSLLHLKEENERHKLPIKVSWWGRGAESANGHSFHTIKISTLTKLRGGAELVGGSHLLRKAGEHGPPYESGGTPQL